MSSYIYYIFFLASNERVMNIIFHKVRSANIEICSLIKHIYLQLYFFEFLLYFI
jgi:hypothetical protein